LVFTGFPLRKTPQPLVPGKASAKLQVRMQSGSRGAAR
jgi:hypothetical protein